MYWLILLVVLVIGGYWLWQTTNRHALTIQILVRQADRWSTAAQQDKNPLIKAVHANYGAAYVWALSGVATDAEIMAAAGVSRQHLEALVMAEQDASNRALIAACPAVVPDTPLARIGKEA